MALWWNVRGSPDVLADPYANHTGDWQYMTPPIALKDGKLDIGSEYKFVSCLLGTIGDTDPGHSLEFRPVNSTWVEPSCAQVNLLAIPN